MRFTTKLLCVILLTLLVGVVVYRYMPIKENFEQRSDATVLYTLMGITVAIPVIFILYQFGQHMNKSSPKTNSVSNAKPLTLSTGTSAQGIPVAQAVPSARRGGARK